MNASQIAPSVLTNGDASAGQATHRRDASAYMTATVMFAAAPITEEVIDVLI